MKVCIVYGWSEGSWQGKLLRKELRKEGFDIEKSVNSADIVIAHSGGAFMVPNDSVAKLILIIGLPHWPDRHPLHSLLHKVKSEPKGIWWYKKTFFNGFYLISRPWRWYRMWKAWRLQKLPVNTNVPVLLIRNSQDHFMHPTKTVDFGKRKNWSAVSLAGYHDDVWMNPVPYVKLLKIYREQLEA